MYHLILKFLPFSYLFIFWTSLKTRQRVICRAVWRTEGERNSKARTRAGDRELAQSKRAKARAALGKEKKNKQSPANVRGDRKAGYNRMRLFYDWLLSFGFNDRAFLSNTPLSPRKSAGFRYIFRIFPGFRLRLHPGLLFCRPQERA